MEDMAGWPGRTPVLGSGSGCCRSFDISPSLCSVRRVHRSNRYPARIIFVRYYLSARDRKYIGNSILIRADPWRPRGPSSVVRISSSRTSSVLLHNAVWRLPLRPPLYTRSNLMVLHQQADAIPKSRNRDNCLRSPSPQYEGRSQPPEPFPVRLLRPCDGAQRASRHKTKK